MSSFVTYHVDITIPSRRLTSLTDTWALTPATRARHPIGRYKAGSASREPHAHGAHISLPSLRSRQKSVNSANKRCCSGTGGLGGRTQRRDAVAAGQGVGVERGGGRRCLCHRRRQHIRVPRRHSAAIRRPFHQFLHQVRPSATCPSCSPLR
jgi:hypothetical protein